LPAKSIVLTASQKKILKPTCAPLSDFALKLEPCELIEDPLLVLEIVKENRIV